MFMRVVASAHLYTISQTEYKMILLVLSVATVLYLLYLYFSRTHTHWEKKNIVGPKPLPFFGNFLDSILRRKRFGEVVAEIYNQFRNEKVVGFYRMTTPTLLINDVELIKQVMIKDFDCFTDRGIEFSKEGLGLNLFHADGDSWRMLRNRFTPIFTTGKLKNMLYLMVDCGEAFMQYVDQLYQSNSEQDVYELVQKFTISTISACAFGVDIDIRSTDYSPYKTIDKKAFTANYAFEADMLYPGVLKKFKSSIFPMDITKYFFDIVSNVNKARNGKPSNRKDFMDLMLQLREEGELHGSNRLSKDETSLEITDTLMAAQAFIFYIAGYETSATTMTFMLYQLAMNPKVQDKLLAEIDEVMNRHNGEMTYDALFDMKYFEMVMDETLRLYPIVDVLQRNAKVDYKLPGTDVVVEKGQTVMVVPLALHYDERYFKNPHKFDPERFAPENAKEINLGAYMPFGTGPRNCIGMRFAKVQSRVCLVNLLSKYRVEPSPKTKKDMIYDPYRLVVSPLGGMPLKLVPRVK